MLDADDILTPASLQQQAGAGAYQVVSAAGATAITPLPRTTSYDNATAAADQTSALADGAYLGQRKTLRAASIASTKTIVITPAHFVDGTTITLAAKFDAVELEWQAAGWVVCHKTGTAAVA